MLVYFLGLIYNLRVLDYLLGLIFILLYNYHYVLFPDFSIYLGLSLRIPINKD